MSRLLTVATSFALALGSTALAQETGLLALHGLEAGLDQPVLVEQISGLGGKLACRASTVEKRLAECTAVLTRSPDHRTWAIRASVVDGKTAILIANAQMTAPELSELRSDLSKTIGRPNLRQQGELLTYEWVRGGRMMRLSSKPSPGRMDVSVSLIDGPALDRLAGTG